jgi:hypothetical protein
VCSKAVEAQVGSLAVTVTADGFYTVFVRSTSAAPGLHSAVPPAVGTPPAPVTARWTLDGKIVATVSAGVKAGSGWTFPAATRTLETPEYLTAGSHTLALVSVLRNPTTSACALVRYSLSNLHGTVAAS